MPGLPPIEAEIRLLTQGAISELNKFLNVLRQTSTEVAKIGGGAAGVGLTKIAGGVQEIARAGAAAIKVTDQTSAALVKTTSAMQSLGTATKQTASFAEVLIRNFGRIALFTVAAGELLRVYFAIKQAIVGLAEEGIRFNGVLEQGQIALAAILATTRNIGTTQAGVLNAAASYPLFLAKAAQFQRRILELNIETLGTAEDLTDVFRLVLAFSAQQKASDEERLQLAQNLLNAGQLLGLTVQQNVVETRQILTLERANGQQILANLGVTIGQARAWKEQGTLIQHLNELLSAFSAIGKDLALTWNGLVSSASTFVSLFTAQAFKGTFDALKEALFGFFKQLQALSGTSLFANIGASQENLRALGRTAADFVAALTTGLVAASAATIDFLSNTRTLWILLGTAISIATQALVAFLSPLRLIGEAIALLGIGVTGASEAFYNYGTAVNSALDPLPEQTENIDQQENAFSRLAAAISEVTFAQFLNEIARVTSAAAEGAAIVGTLGFLIGTLLGGAFSPALLLGTASIAIGAAIGIIADFADHVTEELASIQGAERLTHDFAVLRDELDKLSGAQPKNAKDLEVLADAFKRIQVALALLQVQARGELVGKDLETALQNIAAVSALLAKVEAKFEQQKQKSEADAAAIISRRAAAIAEAAKAELALAIESSKAIGDIQGVLEAQFAAIEKDRLAAIAKAKGDAETIAAINRTAATERQKAIIETTQLVISELNKEASARKSALEAQTTLEKAFIDARITGFQSTLTFAQQELQLAQKYGASLEQQIAIQQRINNLQISIAQAAIESTQAQISGAEKVLAINKELAADLEVYKERLEQAGNIAAAAAVKTALAAVNVEIVKGEANLIGLVAQLEAARGNLTLVGVTGVRAFRDLEQEAAKFAFISIKSIGDALDQVITGILQGTQSLGNIFSSLGQSLGVKFFKQLLVGKGDFDKALIGNISQLVLGHDGGILGAIFGTGGQLAAGNFVNNFLQGFGNIAGSIQNTVNANQVIWQSAGTRASGSFISSFLGGVDKLFGSNLSQFSTSIGSFLSSAGTIAAIAFAGSQIGGFLNDLLGTGKSKEGRIGAQVLGGLTGGLFGPLGGLIGDLFAHIPTKGTQIRKSVVDFLKEIGATFASEISSKNYFFEETKALAKQMFGGDFLAASKKILTDEAGPELAAQLQALGTFLTADQAIKLGKSVEQTGTTFGNLLLANLGVDRISDAIQEIIQKAGIDFTQVIEKLNSVFEQGKIGADFYKAAILGAVDLFTQDLPAGIDVARIALASFTEQGIFDLKKFQDAILEVATQARNIQDALTKAITEGISGNLTRAEVEINFKTNLQQVIRDMLIAKTIAEGLGDVFKDIDLSVPLDPATIELLAGRVGDLYDNVIKVLTAAGLLPDAFKDAADDAADAVKQLIDIAATAKDALKSGFDAVLQGITDGLSSGQAIEQGQAAFEKFFQDALRNAIIEQTLAQAIVPLLAGLDLTKPIDLSSDAFKNLKDQVGAVYDNLLKVLEAAGLLSNSIDETNGFTAQGLLGWESTADELAHIMRISADVADETQHAAEAAQDATTHSASLADALDDSADATFQVNTNLHNVATIIEVAVTKAESLAAALRSAADAAIDIQFPATTSATGRARGGLVGGSGTGDKIPALLEPGEFVVTTKATQKNLALLAQLNADMEVAQFAHGGLIGDSHINFPPSTQPPTGDSFFRGDVKALQRAVDDTTESLEDLAKQIEEITIRRFAITTSLADQFAQIGAISQTQAVRTRLDVLHRQLDPLIIRFIAGAKLTAEELQKAEDLTNQLRSAIVDRYQAEVDAINDASKKRIDGLQKELDLAKRFQSVAKDLDDSITRLVTGSQSPLSTSEQFGFLQRQAALLRQQLATATPEKQPDIIRELSDVLQQMLGLNIFQKPSPEYRALFDSIVRELEKLREQAIVGGGTDINIAALEKAIEDQTAATTAAIDALRQATVTELTALAAQEDQLAAAQQALLQAQIDGTASGRKDRHEQHEKTNTLLSAILKRFEDIGVEPVPVSTSPFDPTVEGTISAQSGFFGGPLRREQLFLAHPGEYVSIGHTKQMGSTNINISHEINVTAPAGSDGPQIGRGIESILLQSWRTGSLGSEIRKEIRRNK